MKRKEMKEELIWHETNHAAATEKGSESQKKS